jgi:hypothetical protein
MYIIIQLYNYRRDRETQVVGRQEAAADTSCCKTQVGGRQVGGGKVEVHLKITNKERKTCCKKKWNGHY